MKDLYAQLSKHPGFSDTREWDGTASVYEIFEHLMSAGLKLSGNPNFLQLRMEKKYRLVDYVPMGDWDGFGIMCIAWMPVIKKQYPRFHDFALNIFRHMTNGVRLSTFDHWMDNSFLNDSLQDYIMNWDGITEKEQEEAHELLTFYEEGLPAQYFRSLWGKPISLDRLRKGLRCRIPRGKIQEAYEWLLTAIPIIEQKKKLGEYWLCADEINEPDHGDAPVEIVEVWGFCWTNSDYIYHYYTEWIDNRHSNGGDLPPFTPVPLGETKTNDPFIPDLYKWLNTGMNLFKSGRAPFKHYEHGKRK